MKMTDIKQKAQSMGLKAGKLNKSQLIKKIQEVEGNFSCFQTASASCDQANCCWRDDCLVH